MKYPIKKEFGIYRFFRAPVNAFTVRAAKVFLSVCYKGMRSSENLIIEKKRIVSSDGKKVGVYLIIPRNLKENSPYILYLHGGGFVFKGAPYHYKLAKEYALRTQSAVAFVDYRLAFDKPRGATLADCLFAYKFVLTQAALFKDGARIYFAGDSAGAYLCLALTELCIREGLPLPQKLMLAYPVADPLMQSPSMRAFPDAPMWNPKLNRKMWELYSGGEEVFNPLKADLSAFPPAYIETAEYDCLHDEGVALCKRFAECGINCVINETKGTMHGFDIRYNAPTTRAAVDSRIEFLKK